MLFRRDEEDHNRVWVDRGIDSKVDSFEPCGICDAILEAKEPRNQVWHDFDEEFCPGCRTGFAAEALEVDLSGAPRPFNGDLEGRVISNQEFEEERPPVDPSPAGYYGPELPYL